MREATTLPYPYRRLLDIGLSVFWLLFVLTNVRAFLATGAWLFALAIAESCLVSILFLVREKPAPIPVPAFDTGIAFAGTFFMLLLRPAAAGWGAVGTPLLALGFSLSILSLVYLGRSFGIAPARRTLKLGGPYRFVRHPMYLSHIIAGLGYTVGNISLWNLVVVLVGSALLVARTAGEERVLAGEGYDSYKHRTRYRLLPYIF